MASTISGKKMVGTYDVTCPACDETIPIPVECWQVDAKKTHEGKASLSCEPDLADLWAHMWTHEGAER